KVRYVSRPACFDDGFKDATRYWRDCTCSASHCKRWRNIVRRREAKSVFFTKIEHAEFGVTNADSLRQHGRKHRLQIAGRASNNSEGLRGCRLLLQRLGEVGGAMAEFIGALAQLP